MAKKKDDGAEGEGEEKKGGLGGKLKLVAMILPTVLLIAGAVYFFVFAKSDSSSTSAKAKASAAAAAAEGEGEGEATDGEEDGSAASSTYVAGKLAVMEPITVNLANGHYIKIGLALQFTADAGEETSTSKAADAVIAEFTGKTVDELATADGRNNAKKNLLKVIKKSYEKKVYEVFYTTYVMN